MAWVLGSLLALTLPPESVAPLAVIEPAEPLVTVGTAAVVKLVGVP